jgi:hypothetical protein
MRKVLVVIGTPSAPFSGSSGRKSFRGWFLCEHEKVFYRRSSTLRMRTKMGITRPTIYPASTSPFSMTVPIWPDRALLTLE